MRPNAYKEYYVDMKNFYAQKLWGMFNITITIDLSYNKGIL